MASGISQEWKVSLVRKASFQKPNGLWYFEIDYIRKSWAKEGRNITKSNSNRYNSIGYETFEECEKVSKFYDF